ncbi:hypothetical protein HII36_53170, partial [Nonomuraea sp. NN258]|uniref:hypothetical protein n=1 Tax=Nonomuraea antri TaxID=2730852 RepID=UPI001C2BF4D3
APARDGDGTRTTEGTRSAEGTRASEGPRNTEGPRSGDGTRDTGGVPRQDADGPIARTDPDSPTARSDADGPNARADADRPAARPDADTTTTTAAATPPRDGSARVPFEFERFYSDARWSAESTRFEQRLGAYYFNDPRTLDAARTAVGKMRDVLLSLTPRQEGESRAAFTRRVEDVFFRDDALDSAGQVGKGRLTVDELIATGNLRELMTAFYNGAYFNYNDPHIFGNALLRVIDDGLWDQAGALGLDVEQIRGAQRQLDDSVNRPLLGFFDRKITGDQFRFARDPFGTGNVLMQAERGVRDLAEVVQSQRRHDRTPAEQKPYIRSPGYYEEIGAPLGRHERAFVESRTGPLLDVSPLPWREGLTAHDSSNSRWARHAAADGYLVVDGVSGTTSRMLTAAKFLNLGPGMNEAFLGALMGWMLPGRDHSLFEITRGAQMVDVGGLRLEPGVRTSAVDLHRSLPGLDLGTLRREILPDGLFPHESRYLQRATEQDGFSETRHPKVRETAERLWPQLDQGRVTDPDLAGWLRRNGIDPDDAAQVRGLAERLSPAHVMALTVYTRHSHYLINNVTRTQLWTAGMSESAVQTRMAQKVTELVSNYLDNLATGRKALPLPLELRPLLHAGDGHLDSRSPLNATAQAWMDAAHRAEDAKTRAGELRAEGHTNAARQAESEVRDARRDQRAAWRELREDLADVTPRLFDEMRWHADMVHDAMLQLPALGTPDRPVLAYRGDWITPVYSPIYGSKLFPYGVAREFMSVSTLVEVAVRFMAENPASDRKVLVVYLLNGGQARDISVFSSFAEDQEAVFPPHSRAHRVDNPELVERVRAEAERAAQDLVRRGVLPEAPTGYDIIVMEED